MRVTGTHQFKHPPAVVWRTLTDPDALRRCIPGCEHFAVTAPYTYTATLSIGVAALRGIYKGTATLSEVDEPRRCMLHVKGGGGPGHVEARARFDLRPTEDGATLAYDGVVKFRGLIGFLPMNVLTPVAYKVLDAFFTKMSGFMDQAQDDPVAASEA